MIKPKLIIIKNGLGVDSAYIISIMNDFNSIEFLENFSKCDFTSNKPSDYKLNERFCRLLFKNISVILPDGKKKRLKTKKLIDEYCDFRQGILLESETLKYNLSHWFGDITFKKENIK